MTDSYEHDVVMPPSGAPNQPPVDPVTRRPFQVSQPASPLPASQGARMVDGVRADDRIALADKMILWAEQRGDYQRAEEIRATMREAYGFEQADDARSPAEQAFDREAGIFAPAASPQHYDFSSVRVPDAGTEETGAVRELLGEAFYRAGVAPFQGAGLAGEMLSAAQKFHLLQGDEARQQFIADVKRNLAAAGRDVEADLGRVREWLAGIKRDLGDDAEDVMAELICCSPTAIASIARAMERQAQRRAHRS
jgi:hypothetical protein